MIFRIKFAKYGVVRFVGHLDVMRYFQKVIRRSRLPVSYSQGFSPHQLMSFALPLGVGITSDGEYMETEFDDEEMYRLAGSTAPKDLEKTIFVGMNANTTEGFEVLQVKLLPAPVPGVHQEKAMALVSAADYLIRAKDGYDTGFADEKELFGEFDGFMRQESITVTKKTKKSEKELNIRKFIYGYGDAGDIRDTERIRHARQFDNGLQLTLRLAAGSQMNIKPELVLEAFYEYCAARKAGLKYDDNAFALHRMELYRTKGDGFGALL